MDGIYYKYNVNVFTVLRNAIRCCLSHKRAAQALDYGGKPLKIQPYTIKILSYAQYLNCFQEFYQYSNDLPLLHMKLNLAKLYISQRR
uniref:Uncharacterized protein n=1 Tax=Ditylenchus dipsaci TaxID=166011 RepID=A0A915DUZ4_9BILA